MDARMMDWYSSASPLQSEMPPRATHAMYLQRLPPYSSSDSVDWLQIVEHVYAMRMMRKGRRMCGLLS